jgi:hypothetical protein
MYSCDTPKESRESTVCWESFVCARALIEDRSWATSGSRCRRIPRNYHLRRYPCCRNPKALVNGLAAVPLKVDGSNRLIQDYTDVVPVLGPLPFPEAYAW